MGSDAAVDVFIQRFTANYLVQKDHPSPLNIRSRLDALVRDLIGDAIAQYVAANSVHGSKEMWFIRKLEVDVAVNSAWQDDVIIANWARKFVATLSAEIESGTYNDSVVRFSDRKEYVAQFLVDLLDGAAWSKWYYREFSGLKLLTSSSALRTALNREEKQDIDDVLTSVYSRRSKELLSTISEADAGALLSSLKDGFQSDDSYNANSSIRAWTSTIELLIGNSFFSSIEGINRRVLGAWLHLKAIGGESPDRKALFDLNDVYGAVRFIDAIVYSPRSEYIIHSLSHSENIETVLTSLISKQAFKDPAPILSFLRLSVADRASIYKSIKKALGSEQAGSNESDKSDSAFVRRYTRYGGIFLLLPIVNDFVDKDFAGNNFVDDDSGLGDSHSSYRACLSLVILSKCMGHSSYGYLLSDPLIREVLQLSPRTSIETLKEWESEALHDQSSDEIAGAILREFARKLPGFSGSSESHLRNNFLCSHAIVESENISQGTTSVYRVILSRTPLHLILNITGLVRQSYRLPNSGALVQLFPEEVL